jgi:hypothetical protein
MTEEIASFLHEELCYTNVNGCPRYRAGHEHYEYYQQRALVFLERLSPLIGSANVLPVIKILTEEM